MPVALLTSPGWRGAVPEKRRFCRHPSSGGLEKAREGEERPFARWSRGRERSVGLRPATRRHSAALSSPGPEVGSVLTLAL